VQVRPGDHGPNTGTPVLILTTSSARNRVIPASVSA
jgi:hypothetical protein